MDLTEEEFWTCIWILLRNYHAINRKIFACVLNGIQKVENGIDSLVQKIINEQSITNLADLVDNNKYQHQVWTLSGSSEIELQRCLQTPHRTRECEGFVVLLKFLSKKHTENVQALGIIDFCDVSYACRFQNSPFLDFRVKFIKGKLTVQILDEKQNRENAERWANYVLEPKLLKWAQGKISVVYDSCQNKLPQSLQLINLEQYNDLYKELKVKYAEKALKFWEDANECTDPLKFIYEDLAIAAYLICLWRSPNKGVARPPTAFADLGCGNGLLVYILQEAGYPGYGYDVRARKLWSFYPENTQGRLIEKAITPDSFQFPDEVDWLIGNHSDELSPWLPVLSATSSYEMSYFLLPCCTYELSGAKFQRRNAKISGYHDFYAYAQQLSDSFGFLTLTDRLKIPSTKRLALIGMHRSYSREEFTAKCEAFRIFVQNEIQRNPSNINGDVGGIKLREKEFVIKNCTQIDPEIIATLIDKIFNLLLTTTTTTKTTELDNPNLTDNNNGQWRTGGRLSLGQIVQHLTSEDLRHIKAECGGIKTLIKNKHEIFQFYEINLVGLRRPQPAPIGGGQTVAVQRKRPCYFNQKHPDGCPLTDAECRFMH